ncbi:MAG: hypothetical protein HY329_10215, partial [Chloroflexi bacterium]|nr:hypothetical protein [Chloroflexota bacterium]
MNTKKLKALESRRSEKGQAIILFAITVVAMMGMMGLALDVGYVTYQRRAAQNAADAAVLAGLNTIYNNNTNIGTTLIAAASRNGMPSPALGTGQPTTPETTNLECTYLNNDGSAISPVVACVEGTRPPTGSSPAGAGGLRVSVHVSRNALFLRVMGINKLSVSATAAGYIQTPDISGTQSPFMTCGFQSDELPGSSSSAADVSGFEVGPDTQIMIGDNSTAQLNPAAVGKWYILEDQSFDPTCGYDTPSGWKGLVDSNTAISTLPGWFEADTGTKTGPIRQFMQGQCDYDLVNTTNPNGCYMVIPVIGDSSGAALGLPRSAPDGTDPLLAQREPPSSLTPIGPPAVRAPELTTGGTFFTRATDSRVAPALAASSERTFFVRYSPQSLVSRDEAAPESVALVSNGQVSRVDTALASVAKAAPVTPGNQAVTGSVPTSSPSHRPSANPLETERASATTGDRAAVSLSDRVSGPEAGGITERPDESVLGATNCTLTGGAVTLTQAAGGQSSNYTIQFTVPNDNACITVVSQIYFVVFPAGTVVSTITSGTFQQESAGTATAIDSIAPNDATRTVRFTAPTMTTKNRWVKVVLNGVTNPQGSATGANSVSLSLSSGNASGGTNSGTATYSITGLACTYTISSFTPSPATSSTSAAYNFNLTIPNTAGCNLTTSNPVTINLPTGTNAAAATGTWNGSAITFTTRTATQLVFSPPTAVDINNSVTVNLSSITNPS